MSFQGGFETGPCLRLSLLLLVCIAHAKAQPNAQPAVAQQGGEALSVSGNNTTTGAPTSRAASPSPPPSTAPASSPPAVSSGPCTQVPNTLLVYKDELSTSTVDTADDCCTRCRNTPKCTLWAYCPKTTKDGCFTSHTNGYAYPSAGGCTLYALEAGKQAVVDQQGQETPWVSGYYKATPAPPSPATPSVPPASPAPPSTVPPASPPAAKGACTQVPNKLLVYSDELSSSTVDTPDDCCTRCRNTPKCTLWAYCPKTANDGCYTSYTNGYAYPGAGGCTLYALEAGKEAKVDQEGPETLWVSGYYNR